MRCLACDVTVVTSSTEQTSLRGACISIFTFSPTDHVSTSCLGIHRPSLSCLVRYIIPNILYYK